MELLKGIDVANAINEKLIKESADMGGRVPKLAVIRVGERPDDMSYERGATKKMEKVGFACESFVFPETIENEAFQKEFDTINDNPEIDGILLLRPLPKHLDEEAVVGRISPEKDLDGISPVNLAKVFAGDKTGFAPCTAEAVVEMLDFAGIDVTGKRVTVVGRSLVIGKPVSMLLLKKNATVTICHTKTKDMKEEIRKLLAGKILMVKPSGDMIRWIVTDAGPFVPCGWDIKRSTRVGVPVLPTQPERSVWSGDSIAFPPFLFPGWLFLSFPAPQQ